MPSGVSGPSDSVSGSDVSFVGSSSFSASVPWQKEFLALAERAWRCGAYDRENYPIEVRDCLSRALSLIGAHADVAESELRYTGKYRRDELRRKPPSGIPQSGRQFRADAC